MFKKLLLIALFLVAGSTAIFAQQDLRYWDAAHGKWYTVGSALDNINYVGPLPILATPDSTVYWLHPVTHTKYYSDTTSTSGDTVTADTTLLAWWKLSIVPDDTIYVSSDVSFPATNRGTVFPGESYTTDKLSYTIYKKFYYKQYGTGNANVRIFWEGY